MADRGEVDHSREALAGLVERVTFHSPETGFCVLRVKVRGQRELVTVRRRRGRDQRRRVRPGQRAYGQTTATHGLQFKAAFLKAAPPTTLEGIERYLGSGMIKGIGPRSTPASWSRRSARACST